MEQEILSSNVSLKSSNAKIIRFLGLLFTLGYTLLFVVSFVTQLLPDNIYTVLITYYSPFVAGIALILIYIRAKSSPIGANSQKAYFGLTLAVFFYFLGEVFFIIPGITDNYPSIADLWWTIGTIFFIDEMFFMVNVIDVHFSKKQYTLIYGITGLSVVSLVVLVFGAVITTQYVDPAMVLANPDLTVYTPFMKAMDLFYFVGDALILFGTIYVTFGLFSKTGFKLSPKHLAWIFLILGNLSMIFGDAFYSYLSLKGTETLYTIDNLLYVFQYMFWALAFVFFPEYLSRSFNTGNIEEEFIPVETKKNMNFIVPKVSEILSTKDILTDNSLTFSGDKQSNEPNHGSD